MSQVKRLRQQTVGSGSARVRGRRERRAGVPRGNWWFTGSAAHAGELEEEEESQPSAQKRGEGRGRTGGRRRGSPEGHSESLTGRVMTRHAGGRRWVGCALS